MGDRENPIKFGPEWLRNLASERGTGNTGLQGSNREQGASGGAGPNNRRGGTSSDSFPSTSSGTSTSANGTVGLRVQLANLRYGREEMLALYEAAADPPTELTNNELLYQSRGKQPFALSTTFDDEMREGLRSGSHTGAGADRFNVGRGLGPRFRTTGSTVPTRPRSLASTGEGHFAGTLLDTSVRPQLSQRNPRYQPNTEHKPMFYPNYVGANTFRSKRQSNIGSTNWRSSQAREGGDEWRSEPGRARTGQDRERDRERPGPSSNRRSSDHEETIPEWAFANAEACGGTFDSSGAFHGYSNDDSNLPKNQDNGYSLSRSRTHNSLSRSKTIEEGSEEWWASEKAKKLSPKRFDAGDIKFKQGTGIQDLPLAQNVKSNASNEEHLEEPHKESPSNSTEEPVKESGDFGDNYNKGYKPQFSESKPFDSMMRQDINIEEAHTASANDQRGNFQSVMITPNNSLRQKHQNIVSSPNEPMNRAQGLMSMKYTAHGHTDKDISTKHQTFDDKILDDFLDLTLETNEISASVLMGPPSGGAIANQSLPQMQERGHQQGLQTASLQNQGLSMNNVQNLSSLGIQAAGLAPGAANLNNPSINPHVMSPQLEFGSTLGLQGVPQGVMANNHGLDGAGLQRGVPAFQNSSSIPGMANSNVANNSLFLGNNSNSSGDIPMPNHAGSMFPIHGLQHSGSQGAFSSSVFNNMMQQPPPAPATPLTEQWYYEDPDKNVQGPFSCREMYNWYRAGFFTPSLMVRRACEREMRPLGSYGPLVPFVQLDVLPPFPMSGFDTRPTMNQSGIGLGVMPISDNDQPIPMPPSAQNAMQNPFPNIQAAPMSPLHNASVAPPIHVIQNTVNMPPLMRSAAHSGMPVFGSVSLGTNPSVAQQQNVVMPISDNDQPIPMPPSAQNAMQNPFPNIQAAPMSPLHNASVAPPIHVIQNTVNMPPLMRSAAHSGMPVFGSVSLGTNPSVAQQQNVFDSLWGQAPQDVMWMQRNPPIENRVNNLPLYFWEQQPTAIAANQLLPESITKEMKTEDQILAQLRAAQNMTTQPNTAVQPKTEAKPLTSTAAAKPMDAFSSPITATYFELHNIIHKDIKPSGAAPAAEPSAEPQHTKQEKSNKTEQQPTPEESNTKLQQNTTKTEIKTNKQSKENEKAIKTKENTKTKNKKKDEKKDDTGDGIVKDEDSTEQKRSVESSPVKSKKEEKSNKKELDKEKKEWIKEGFTIVKGSEKGNTRDNKKKVEEGKPLETADKKKKELLLPSSFFCIPRSIPYIQKQGEEKRKPEEPVKKLQVQQSKPSAESLIKKAPWSASQGNQFPNIEGLTLAEIQRLEREKKLEQMKEQQQMMQMIAQQQAHQIAREQEMQANLAWANRNTSIAAAISPSLAEIQAQEQVSRKQQAAASGVPTPAPHDERPPAPWGTPPNGGNHYFMPGGFWEAYSKSLEIKAHEQKLQDQKQQELREQESKTEVPKTQKKKVPANSNGSSNNNNSGAFPGPPAAATAPAKKATSPAAEFETWCTTTLNSWSSKIDVPTFIGFLKDIESPYEVKDYVRCYLGDTKESGDFARNFLERRSKLLRVGMVTPSDDLCSPALAINPRTNSQSDYQEVKGKGKKVKKNKMLKVDARFLGFSATAAEDRINVGDIDTV